MEHVPENAAPELIVFHDGRCPVCRMEIAHYRRLDREGRVAWIDIMEAGDAQLAMLTGGLSREALLDRFHVAEPQAGKLHSGPAAFKRLWRAMPGWRRIAFLFDIPGMPALTELLYRLFLVWQRRDRARRMRLKT